MSIPKSTVGTFVKTYGPLKQNSNGTTYSWCYVNILGKQFPAMIYNKSIDLAMEGEELNVDIRLIPGSKGADGNEVPQLTAWHPSLLQDSTPLPTVADFEALFAPKKATKAKATANLG
jgi:hypothetical protein